VQRRDVLRSAVGVAAGIGLAGCLGGDEGPPPRRANVFDDVSASDGQLQVELVDQPRVESRKDLGNASLDGVAAGTLPDGLSPVGVASAQKGGGRGGGGSSRGATGRGRGGYSGAPSGRHGWAVWHARDDDDEWRENHADEVEMYPARVDRMGVEFLGPTAEYEDRAPGPGYVPQATSWDDPDPGTTVSTGLAAATSADTAREGWYRLGVHLVHRRGEADFGWQGADLKLDEDGSWGVDKAWHVRPLL
jgi:hypothetical protein